MTSLNQTAIEEILRQKVIIDVAVEQIVNQLADQDIPLDDRWNTFVKFCVAGLITDVDGYGDGNLDHLVRINGEENSIQDDFYMQRFETTSWKDFYDRITDANDYTAESITDWQEAVLSSGTCGFTWDW